VAADSNVHSLKYDTVLRESLSEQLTWEKMKTAKYGKVEHYIWNCSGKSVLFIIPDVLVKNMLSGFLECVRNTKEKLCFDVEREPLMQNLYATIF
jgi:hypothetical protein